MKNSRQGTSEIYEEMWKTIANSFSSTLMQHRSKNTSPMSKVLVRGQDALGGNIGGRVLNHSHGKFTYTRKDNGVFFLNHASILFLYCNGKSHSGVGE